MNKARKSVEKFVASKVPKLKGYIIIIGGKACLVICYLQQNQTKTYILHTYQGSIRYQGVDMGEIDYIDIGRNLPTVLEGKSQISITMQEKVTRIAILTEKWKIYS